MCVIMFKEPYLPSCVAHSNRYSLSIDCDGSWKERGKREGASDFFYALRIPVKNYFAIQQWICEITHKSLVARTLVEYRPSTQKYSRKQQAPSDSLENLS